MRLCISIALFGCGSGGGRRPESDGGVDAGCPDGDGDGHAALECGGDDCDDADPGVLPGGPDALGDGRDTNCDGSDGLDLDRDGYGDPSQGGLDCDDGDAAVHPGAPDDGEWHEEVIADDTAVQVNTEPDLLVDEDGKIHVAWCDGNTYEYATDSGGAGYRTEPIAGSAIWMGGLAMGSHGDLHFAYGAQTSPSTWIVRHAWRGAGGWESETLDDVANDQAGWVDLAIDGDDHLHATYAAGWEVRYATDASGEWATQPIGQSNTFGGLSVIALLPDGRPFVAYHDAGSSIRALVPGEDDERVPTRGEGGMPLQMRVDALGTVHLVYMEIGPDAESYARREGDAWVVDPIGAMFFGSVDADAHGGAHIVYVGRDSAVTYATNARGEWETESLGAGSQPAVALGDGRLHLVLLRDRSLVHAWQTARDGVDNDCDGEAW